MPHRLQHQLLDLFGGSTFIMSISLFSADAFKLVNINTGLTTVSLLVGVGWVLQKWWNLRKEGKKNAELKEQESKINELDIQIKQKELNGE